MAITNRKLSHLPRLEALEDRFLPSVSSLLPFNNGSQLGHNGVVMQDQSVVKNNADKNSSDGLIGSSGQKDQRNVADSAFDPSHGDLAQTMTYRPIVAVITYDPISMGFHETIWYVLIPTKSMASPMKSKGPSSNSLTPDSDDMNGVVRNVAPQVPVNSLATVRPNSVVNELAKDLVETAMPASTNRSMETVVATNKVFADLSVSTPIVLPKYSTIVTAPQESQGIGLRSEAQPNEIQDPVPVPLSNLTRGVVTMPDLSSRLTEKLGLNTDESSLILNEIEQAIQTLVEPFALSLQSYESSILWVFLSTWIAAAGISYEYLRRKMQFNQLSLDTWKEWRSIPVRHHS